MFHVLLPFLLALLCYFMMKPLIDHLEKKFHIKRSAIGISLLLVVYLVVGMLLGIGLVYAFMMLFEYARSIPQYYQDYMLPILQNTINWLKSQYPQLMNNYNLSVVQDYLGQYIFQIIGYVSYFITQLPKYVFTFFLFMISTFFLMLDYDDIRSKLASLVSPYWMSSFIRMKNKCLKSLRLYIKCQFILMVICFVILCCGFMIIRYQYSFFYALITALLDSLPFIGVGIVLIPICFVYVLQGYYLKAFYIFLIYLIINVVRSLLEPQIMNKQIHVPSFLLLLSMMIHLSFFGVVGIILSPIHMSILYSYLSHDD